MLTVDLLKRLTNGIERHETMAMHQKGKSIFKNPKRDLTEATTKHAFEQWHSSYSTMFLLTKTCSRRFEQQLCPKKLF